MRYAELPVPAALKDVVRFLWTLESDAAGSFPHRLTAEPCPNIVLIMRGAFTEADGSPAPALHLAGALSKPADMAGHGPFSIMGAYLWPWAVRALFGRSPGQCMDRFTALDGSIGRVPATAEGLRTGAFAAWLERLPRHPRAGDPAMDRIVRTMLLEAEHRPITERIGTSGLSRRAFERRFKERTGFPPALFQRIVRLQRTYRMLENGTASSLTEVAHAAGYADQSHFIRDFKRFSGLNPRSYFVKAPARVDNFLQLPQG